MQSREKLDVLVDRQIAVEAEPLREIANGGRGAAVSAVRIGAKQADGAAVRFEQSAGQAKEGRLSGAVWTDDAEHLTAANLDRDVAERDGRAEGPSDVGP